MAGPPSVSRRRRLLVAIAGFAPLLLRPQSARAARYDLRAIVGTDPQRYSEALDALRQRFGDVLLDDGRHASRTPRPTAYVALGTAGLQAALDARVEAPVVSLFSSRESFERIVASAASPRAVSAIYAEPDPRHQMRLIATLYRRSVAVGTLLSDATAHHEPMLREAASAHGLRLEVARVRAGAGLTRSLNLLDRATVLLIQPDSELYTQTSLRELLESTYRRRLPVIGFSAALVAAGTLASAYSEAGDIAAQLEGLLERLASRRLPPPRYPAYWRVAVNDSVARSLDIVVDASVRSLGDRP
jgi:putative tryptophan/tyrosine transport system substrate-binding protein